MSDEIHPDVMSLVKDKEVGDVLNGKGIPTQLDGEAFRRFMELRISEHIFWPRTNLPKSQRAESKEGSQKEN